MHIRGKTLRHLRMMIAMFVPGVAMVLLMSVGAAAMGSRQTGPEGMRLAGDGGEAVAPLERAPTYATGQAFVFHFDPVLESFETFTIPIRGARPHSVDVASSNGRTDVWFTEPGADQIGRLVYTSTAEVAFYEYPVTPGSQPMNLVLDQSRGLVWFTAYAGNRVGRLELGSGSAITLTDFEVPTPQSGPAGIDLAPDGSVWFSERAADKLGQLTVTATGHDFDEFPIGGAETNVGFYGIAVQSDQYIWAGETRTGALRRLNVARRDFVRIPFLDVDSYPYELVVDPIGQVPWFTKRGDNKISLVTVGTLSQVRDFPIPSTTNVMPAGLVLLEQNRLWFSAQATGQVGRMIYVGSQDADFALFDLPVPGTWAMDIAADADGGLWTVAYLPLRAFLPFAAHGP